MDIESFLVRRIQFGPAKNALLLRVCSADGHQFDCILKDGKLYRHRRGSSFARTLDRGKLIPEDMAFLVAHTLNTLSSNKLSLMDSGWIHVRV